MPPAARITDFHACPMVTPGTPPIPHVGGPIMKGSHNVLTGKLPQARVGDMAVCVGPMDVIVKGSSGVFVNKMPAARIGDQTAHGGTIVAGFPTVIIGETKAGGGGGAALPNTAAVQFAYTEVIQQLQVLIDAWKTAAPFCEACFKKAATQATSSTSKTVPMVRSSALQPASATQKPPAVSPSASRPAPLTARPLRKLVVDGLEIAFAGFADATIEAFIAEAISILMSSLPRSMKAFVGRTVASLGRSLSTLPQDALKGVVVGEVARWIGDAVEGSGVPHANLVAAAAEATVKQVGGILTSSSPLEALAATSFETGQTLIRTGYALFKLNDESRELEKNVDQANQQLVSLLSAVKLARVQGDEAKAKRYESLARNTVSSLASDVGILAGDAWKSPAQAGKMALISAAYGSAAIEFELNGPTPIFQSEMVRAAEMVGDFKGLPLLDADYATYAVKVRQTLRLP